jgi:voltage-gated potassium channel Kch
VKRLFIRIFGAVPGIRWLVVGMTSVAIACALVARIFAPDDFPTYGRAFWWSVQTVTTVGYGDVTPESRAGQTIAAVLMVSAIAFISVLTAAISAGFVNRLAGKRRAEEPLFLALERIESRLELLEQALVQERDARAAAPTEGDGPHLRPHL